MRSLLQDNHPRVGPRPGKHVYNSMDRKIVRSHLWTSIGVSSKDPTRTEDWGTSRVSPGVSLVEVNVHISIVEVVKGPHVVWQGGLTLDEGVVGEPHAVPVLTLASGLQTLHENTLKFLNFKEARSSTYPYCPLGQTMD